MAGEPVIIRGRSARNGLLTIGGDGSRQATGPKQPVILRLDRRVAFARGPAEAVDVEDLDVPAAVVDEIRLLQRVGHERNAVAPCADHLGHPAGHGGQPRAGRHPGMPRIFLRTTQRQLFSALEKPGVFRNKFSERVHKFNCAD